MRFNSILIENEFMKLKPEMKKYIEKINENITLEVAKKLIKIINSLNINEDTIDIFINRINNNQSILEFNEQESYIAEIPIFFEMLDLKISIDKINKILYTDKDISKVNIVLNSVNDISDFINVDILLLKYLSTAEKEFLEKNKEIIIKNYKVDVLEYICKEKEKNPEYLLPKDNNIELKDLQINDICKKYNADKKIIENIDKNFLNILLKIEPKVTETFLQKVLHEKFNTVAMLDIIEHLEKNDMLHYADQFFDILKKTNSETEKIDKLFFISNSKKNCVIEAMLENIDKIDTESIMDVISYENKITLSKYWKIVFENMTYEQNKVLINALYANIDLNNLDNRYSPEQMKYIIDETFEGKNVEKIKNPDYSIDYMKKILYYNDKPLKSEEEYNKTYYNDRHKDVVNMVDLMSLLEKKHNYNNLQDYLTKIKCLVRSIRKDNRTDINIYKLIESKRFDYYDLNSLYELYDSKIDINKFFSNETTDEERNKMLKEVRKNARNEQDR